jgi:hypothetical protein
LFNSSISTELNEDLPPSAPNAFLAVAPYILDPPKHFLAVWANTSWLNLVVSRFISLYALKPTICGIFNLHRITPTVYAKTFDSPPGA